MPMQCLLDLDGVLVDFVGHAEKRFGIKVDHWNFDEHLPISRNEFWLSCDEEFWANLEWTVDGREILSIVEEAFGAENVCLLTSPCETDGCMEGKRRWIKKHIPEYAKRFLMGPAKSFCAASNRVLVDDRDENVRDFMANGGEAILVPRPWNSLSGVAVLAPLGYLLKHIKVGGMICG